MSNIKNSPENRKGDLNQKSMQPGRNSDKVDQEGDGEPSTQIDRSYKKPGHTKKAEK